MAICAEYQEFLLSCWGNESEDPSTQEWREDLNEEEQKYVERLDLAYAEGIKAMAEKILEMEGI